MILRAVTVPLEVAHRGVDGIIHGHSLSVQVWTDRVVDLDDYAADVRAALAPFQAGLLEETIGGRTFEDVARRALEAVDAIRVTVRLPSRGHIVEFTR